ncbi:amino acid ABC transporter permease [Fictibacillus aquaticus]|uniref:Amino acid ABC transporter permease n=1 Tax=Fictibacillus aquaticus TaxID=2021314 RepID=A0A235FAW6_9BACL|nr:amino acid ABC transporter permease [Fictibacillus aquaticus]OYD58154.1 amino acid ABC transporter permease [Fictibacillus aquaticus]
MEESFKLIANYLPFFLKGAGYTIIISLLSIIFGTILGLFIGLGKMSPKWHIRTPFNWYVTFFRGTPLLVQILLIHAAVMPIFISPPNVFLSVVVALSLNAGAYIAEIFRAGIQSIDKGQMEAARTLGMTHRQAMRHIILPQASKRMIPPLGNEFIVLIKESSLASVLALPELMYWGRAMMAEYYKPWEPYLTVAFIYLLLTLGLAFILGKVERKFVAE